MLNHVWSTGEPNADLSKAGVLVHAFDNTEAFDPGPWLPCPESEWCRQFGDRISASVINQRQPTVFTQSTAGLVLSPQTDIHCSYVADGGTMSKFCGPGAPAACVPGCADRTTGEPAWCETGSVNIWDCAFRPTDVEVMLRHHRNERATAYNEVVVDPRNWEQRLPEMLLAIRDMHPEQNDTPTSRRRQVPVLLWQGCQILSPPFWIVIRP